VSQPAGATAPPGQLRYGQASASAIDAELAGGNDLVVLRTGSGAETGEGRVRTSALGPAALLGAAVGAAAAGVRAVADLGQLHPDVHLEELTDQLELAGAAGPVRLTVRLVEPPAARRGVGSWRRVVPALLAGTAGRPATRLVAPATAADCYGLMRSALRDEGTVILVEQQALAEEPGPVSLTDGAVPLGRAEVVRPGEQVTIVAAQLQRARALEAATALAASGVSAEVIDPRTLVPFDDATVIASLKKTARLVVLEEPVPGGWEAPLLGRLASACFEHLDAPPRLVAAAVAAHVVDVARELTSY